MPADERLLDLRLLDFGIARLAREPPSESGDDL
jgi:hypothetical protein